MQTLPFEVRHDLEGWKLYWALLEAGTCDPKLLLSEARATSDAVRKSSKLESLSTHPPLAALRKLFRAAGVDPSRYRPSAEALLRRLGKGEELPTINPLVDLNNILSAKLAVPCCVMVEQELAPPFVFRRGLPGESYESLRGPLNLEGKPLLVDERGPCDTPISGNERVKVTAETLKVWLVAYLPAGVVDPETAERTLLGILQAAPAARILLSAQSG
jgi:DNA/RNA-binding domain of Phe-tRNA-synthetase-like protein